MGVGNCLLSKEDKLDSQNLRSRAEPMRRTELRESIEGRRYPTIRMRSEKAFQKIEKCTLGASITYSHGTSVLESNRVLLRTKA